MEMVPGLFYIVPLLARRTGWTADRTLDVFLIGLIALSATVGMAGLWLTASEVAGNERWQPFRLRPVHTFLSKWAMYMLFSRRL